MPKTELRSVKDLSLDLYNYRTIPQTDEVKAVQAMVSIRSDYFWSLTESLLDSGYLPTENIIVLESSDNPPVLTVKEGNRRIAALKLILGLLPSNIVAIPPAIQSKMDSIDPDWRDNNESVPCTIYPTEEAAQVDRIVDLAHGKGEKAGRDQWTTVARARHNRDRNKASEPGLDLLEKYLQEGKNHTAQQADRWAGDYYLTVLDEAMPKIATRIGLGSAPDLAQQYPNIAYRDSVEMILHDIGEGHLGFAPIREGGQIFSTKYGLRDAASQGKSGQGKAQGQGASHGAAGSPGASGGAAAGGGGSSTGAAGGTGQSAGAGTPGGSTSGGQAGGSASGSAKRKPAATPMNDPKTVVRLLKTLRPIGNNRAKVVTLRDEMVRLKLENNPFAFCFLLRSAFEISAKAYCQDHAANGGPSLLNAKGREKSLADLLKDISAHLSNNGQDHTMVRRLHGATTELAKPDGLLSVTSMNQLVHNPLFSITPGDICTLFGNIFPLLEAMNH